MTNFIKRAVTLAGLAVVFGYSQTANAQTTATTPVTNIATVAGSNFTSSSTTPTVVTVGTQIGASALSEADGSGTAPSIVTNTVRVTNKGNVSATFYWSFYTAQTQGAPGAGWNAGFGGAFTALATNATLAPGATATREFRVSVPAAAADASRRSYVIRVTNSYPSTTAPRHRYTGDNGIVYGGDASNANAGGGAAFIDNASGNGLSNGPAEAGTDVTANRTYAITVSAAQISVAKSANITNFWAPGLKAPVPGATITYRIVLSNGSGSAGATGVEVRDTRPANTTRVAESSRSGAYASTYATATSNDDANGGESAANATYVEFTPNGTTANTTAGDGTANGTLAPTATRVHYFRVTIN